MKREFRITLEFKNGLVMRVFTSDYVEACAEFDANLGHGGFENLAKQTLEYGTSDKDGTFFASKLVRSWTKEKGVTQ